MLHSFGNGTDGIQPLYGSLIFDAAGNLYGTTSEGGNFNGGTVFEFIAQRERAAGRRRCCIASTTSRMGRLSFRGLDLRCRWQSLWYDVWGRHQRPRDGVRADARPSVYQM